MNTEEVLYCFYKMFLQNILISIHLSTNERARSISVILNGGSVSLLFHCECCYFQDNGGCSDRAVCNNVGPHQRTCTCRRFYVGDGFTCIGDIMEVTRKTTINRKSGLSLSVVKPKLNKFYFGFIGFKA